MNQWDYYYLDTIYTADDNDSLDDMIAILATDRRVIERYIDKLSQQGYVCV
ncbi:MAG: hypothetical protein ACTMIA_08185 [Vibrio sp.]